MRRMSPNLQSMSESSSIFARVESPCFGDFFFAPHTVYCTDYLWFSAEEFHDIAVGPIPCREDGLAPPTRAPPQDMGVAG